jgi:hypothetical protein
MHQTNQRGHNETSTATIQNQLAYKACRRCREVSARPDAAAPLNILGYNTLTNTIGYRRYQVLSNSWWCDAWMSVDPEAEVAAATARAVVTSVITRAVLSATRHCESPSVHWTRWFLVPSPHALTSGGAAR